MIKHQGEGVCFFFLPYTSRLESYYLWNEFHLWFHPHLQSCVSTFFSSKTNNNRICTAFWSPDPPEPRTRTACSCSTYYSRKIILRHPRKYTTTRTAQTALTRTCTKRVRYAWVCWAHGRAKETKRGHQNRQSINYCYPSKVNKSSFAMFTIVYSIEPRWL